MNSTDDPHLRKIVVTLGDPTLSDSVKPNSQFSDLDLQVVEILKANLKQLSRYQFCYLNNHQTMLADLARLASQTHLVLNLCDEGLFNDPCREHHVPLYLEQLGIPYSGAGADCMLTCYDKAKVLAIASQLGIPVPQTFFSHQEVTVFPVIAKPQKGDGGVGITQKSVAHHQADLLAALQGITARIGKDQHILIQEFLTGKDLTIGILGDPAGERIILPITEEDYSCLPPGLPPIQGYEAKWDPKSPYWQVKSVPAQISQAAKDLIIEASLQLFTALGCQDYARFDWRMDNQGNPKLLEVNPNPGWCWDGHFAKIAAWAGISYQQMLELIIRATEKRLHLSV